METEIIMEIAKTLQSMQEEIKNLSLSMGNGNETLFMQPDEAAQYIGCGKNRMYEDLLKRKDFPKVKLGNKFFINRELLKEWAKKQCQ